MRARRCARRPSVRFRSDHPRAHRRSPPIRGRAIRMARGTSVARDAIVVVVFRGQETVVSGRLFGGVAGESRSYERHVKKMLRPAIFIWPKGREVVSFW